MHRVIDDFTTEDWRCFETFVFCLYKLGVATIGDMMPILNESEV